jgi:hypothetical protein
MFFIPAALGAARIRGMRLAARRPGVPAVPYLPCGAPLPCVGAGERRTRFDVPPHWQSQWHTAREGEAPAKPLGDANVFPALRGHRCAMPPAPDELRRHPKVSPGTRAPQARIPKCPSEPPGPKTSLCPGKKSSRGVFPVRYIRILYGAVARESKCSNEPESSATHDPPTSRKHPRRKTLQRAGSIRDGRPTNEPEASATEDPQDLRKQISNVRRSECALNRRLPFWRADVQNGNAHRARDRPVWQRLAIDRPVWQCVDR